MCGGGYRNLPGHTIVLSMSVPSISSVLALPRLVHWNWARAGFAGILSVAAITVPTDLIDTSWFSRMTPVRPWDYVLAALAVVLTVVAAGLGRSGSRCPRPRGETNTVGAGPMAATGTVALAVGCPLCNKLVVAGLGVSGALEFWAPVQPVLGAVAVLLLGSAVVLRWHVATSGCRATPQSNGHLECELVGAGDSLEARNPR